MSGPSGAASGKKDKDDEGNAKPSEWAAVGAFFRKDPVVRFFKYAVLLCVVAGTLKLTFDCYSHFIARRSIDAELQARSAASLESLLVSQRRDRDGVFALVFEMRCVERDVIALYRILDGYRAALRDAEIDVRTAKTVLSTLLKGKGRTVLKPDIIDKLTAETGEKFDVDVADPAVKADANKVDGAKPGDVEALREEWKEKKKAYDKARETLNAAQAALVEYQKLDGRQRALDEAAREMLAASKKLSAFLKVQGANILKEEIITKLTGGNGAEFNVQAADEELAKDGNLVNNVNPRVAETLRTQWKEKKAPYVEAARKHRELLTEDKPSKPRFDQLGSGIKALEQSLHKLNERADEAKKRYQPVAEVLARYESWTRALVPKQDIESAIGDVLEAAEDAHTEPQMALKCDSVGGYRKAVEAVRDVERTWQEKGFLERLAEPVKFYRRLLLRYFEQGPAAQTLFVTLLIGALGALTFNILRLSNVGWWDQLDDPDWGEIIIAPFLGALAAFAIYLVGSAGLLLTSDVRNGHSTLTASFIGLLGFMSGLLYDEAFGRVRRVGTQIFSGDKLDEAAKPRPEDIELARVLQDAGATLVASLVVKHRLGLRLLAEVEFTFVVPSDTALSTTTMKWWTDMQDANKSAFRDWFRHHHAPKKLFASTAKTTPTLVMDDGKSLPVTFVDPGLKIGGADVEKPDLTWQNGVIHIISTELPS